MKISKKLIISLFIVENILSPVAFAEQVSAVSVVQQKLDAIEKEKNTYLQLWLNVRDQYSRQDQSLIDAWALQQNNSDRKNKEVRTTKVKTTDGDKALRAFIETQSGSNSYDIRITKSDDLIINKTSVEDLNPENLDQLIRNLSSGTFNKQILLSQTQQELEPEILAKLSSEQKAIYIIQQRKLLELSRLVLKKKKASAQINPKLLFLFFSPEAIAATGGKCFNSLGYIATLDASGNCPDTVIADSKYSNVTCSSGQLCNPSYYGLNRTDSGQGVCLTSAEVAAQKTCSDLAPLKTKDDVRSLMSSLMKSGAGPEGGTGSRPERPPQGSGGKGGPGGPGGKNPVSEFIEQALQSCEESNLQSSDSCKELMNRKTLMNGFMVEAKGRNAQGGDRQAGSGKGSARRDSTSEAEVSSLASNNSSNKSSDCGFFCSAGRWLTSSTGIMSMLTIATGVGVYLWTKNKYKKSSTSTASTVTTDTSVTTTGSTLYYGMPAAPTAADYTGVAQ